MSDWLHGLPVAWKAIVAFGFTYLLTAVIYAIVITLARDERGRSFKAISPGLLPPLGILFGLFVVFTAAQVWNDSDRANAAINREASELRTAVIFAASFPGEAEMRLHALVRSYIKEVQYEEWPLMARRAATLRLTPPALNEAMRVTLALEPNNFGQQIAQRGIATAVENALDARRQRIIISRSEVNLLKWMCLFVQAACTLAVIAMIQCDNRLAAALAMAVFATGVAASALLILAHDRPFTGEFSVSPAPLLQVKPAAEG